MTLNYYESGVFGFLFSDCLLVFANFAHHDTMFLPRFRCCWWIVVAGGGMKLLNKMITPILF